MLLTASHLLLVSVLAWGYSQPELDRAWVILQEMHSDGFTSLSAKDVQLLQKSLKRNPNFARAILGHDSVRFVEPTRDGWTARPSANIVIKSKSGTPRFLVVECRAQLGAYPVTVNFESDSFRQSLRYTENGQQTIELGAKVASSPLWVKVRIQPSNQAEYTAGLPEIHVEISSNSEPTAPL